MVNNGYDHAKRRFFRYVMMLALLGGCSSAVSLPWEDKFLDPARVVTREPLEIPPDLTHLPPTGSARGAAQKLPDLPWKPNAREGETPASSRAALSRLKQQQLPGWMQ